MEPYGFVLLVSVNMYALEVKVEDERARSLKSAVRAASYLRRPTLIIQETQIGEMD